MILVDISVWIDHLRKTDAGLMDLLRSALVLTHPFVIGEIALGNLRDRIQVLESLGNLPGAVQASDGEVLLLIQSEGLAGSGLGYLDAHLLASAKLTPGARIWTRDKNLKAAATVRQLAYAERS